MKVSELTGAQLDYWTARAEGVPAEYLTIRQVQRSMDYHVVHAAHEGGVLIGNAVVVLRYSTDWAQGGPLIAKYHVDLLDQWNMGMPAGWKAETVHGNAYGDTPLQAICRAVVRAAFGDYVEEVSVHPA